MLNLCKMSKRFKYQIKRFLAATLNSASKSKVKLALGTSLKIKVRLNFFITHCKVLSHFAPLENAIIFFKEQEKQSFLKDMLSENITTGFKVCKSYYLHLVDSGFSHCSDNIKCTLTKLLL